MERIGKIVDRIMSRIDVDGIVDRIMEQIDVDEVIDAVADHIIAKLGQQSDHGQDYADTVRRMNEVCEQLNDGDYHSAAEYAEALSKSVKEYDNYTSCRSPICAKDQNKSDLITTFLIECCEPNPAYKIGEDDEQYHVKLSHLWHIYNEWCEMTNSPNISRKYFYKVIRTFDDFRVDRTDNGLACIGLRLKKDWVRS